MARTGRPKKTVDVECVCIVCGTKFVIHEWQAKAGRGKLCSRPCYHASRRGQQLPSLRVEPKKKQCEFCGKEFLTGGFGRPRYSRRFCSQSCSTQFKYREGILKGGSKKGHHIKWSDPNLAATEHPTTKDIAWLTGVFEGEGSFLYTRQGLPSLSIAQKDRWILDRIKALFGGSVGRYGDKHSWHIHGSRARGVIMTMYKFLSPHRQEQAGRILR